jgi:hypothetical protein
LKLGEDPELLKLEEMGGKRAKARFGALDAVLETVKHHLNPASHHIS